MAPVYGDERLVPYLIKDANGGPLLIPDPQRSYARLELCCCRFCRISSCQHAKRSHQPGNRRKSFGFGHKYSNAQALETFDICSVITAFPGDDKIRPQTQHALKIDTRRIANLRNASSRRWKIAITGDADDLFARACRKQQFRY